MRALMYVNQLNLIIKSTYVNKDFLIIRIFFAHFFLILEVKQTNIPKSIFSLRKDNSMWLNFKP